MTDSDNENIPEPEPEYPGDLDKDSKITLNDLVYLQACEDLGNSTGVWTRKYKFTGSFSNGTNG